MKKSVLGTFLVLLVLGQQKTHGFPRIFLMEHRGDRIPPETPETHVFTWVFAYFDWHFWSFDVVERKYRISALDVLVFSVMCYTLLAAEPPPERG